MPAAADFTALLLQLGKIFYFIVLPMLLLAGVGFLIQRALGLDMATLTRLNFYFVTPPLIFCAVVQSRLTGGEILDVVLFGLATLALNFLLAVAAARIRRVAPDRRAVFLMTVLFNNSGNYALPLQDLAFRAPHAPGPAEAGGAAEQETASAQAQSLQIFAMLVQNVVTFTLGLLLVTGKEGQGRREALREALRTTLKFPPVYALAASLIVLQLVRWHGADGPPPAVRPFWDALTYMRQGYLAVALCTLGAQLALVRRGKEKYPVTLSVMLRLVGGPLLALLAIHLLDLRGFTAQVMLIASCTPTAINTALLCAQFQNHPDYAARAVFWSTLVSPLTVTLTVWLAQGDFLARLAR
jgi:hypothetical protein